MAEKLNFTVDLEDGVFVARCIELDISTDGLTKSEAVENLKEALNCYFANPDERLDRRLSGNDEASESL
ncbi:type II toxin-antitoxin system HicB family antitoxin [Dechloromonas sp. HYN0024]|uniref:type II toxin-antitoxin system HicB family antitoxin n=1 Tax=Dechloromonas sp. HYN0024 TaxID=2231055 RepID=UPI000E445858|nr:type II toxin-antitoxin system HicB family antitoxin [Dechloromonas sp. HYN0024]AXS79531.1 type II toxin-antitoxin system HicB family antitoxin [Dechloromonas sp. HYN0024]